MTAFVSPAEGRLTSPYGPRERHPVTGVVGFHRGEDIAPPKAGTVGCPLYAALNGVVTHAGGARKPNPVTRKWPANPVTGTWNTGTYIIIKTDYGPTLYYGHPEKIFVKAGQRVKAGDLIGTMGNVGNVTGIHLHFEVWKNSNHNTNYNPRLLFKEFGVAPGSAPVLPKNPSNITGKDWLSMATEKQVRDIVAEEIGKAMASHRTWSMRDSSRHAENVHSAVTTDVEKLLNSAFSSHRAWSMQDSSRHAENVVAKILSDVPGATALATINITTHTEPRSLWTMLRQAANGTVSEAAVITALREAVAAEMPEEIVAKVDSEAIANRVAETFGARLSSKFEETV